MGSLPDDVRYGLRLIGRNRGFSLVVVLSLAVGIGANTAVFSLVSALLLRPLPVDRPGELAAVYTSDFSGPPFGASSLPDYRDFRDRATVFSGLAAFGPVVGSVVLGGTTERANGSFATGNYWQVVGVQAAHGRVFTSADDTTPGAHPVAVLSDRFWRRVGGDLSVLNGPILINGQPFTVIGIAPPSFTGTMPFFEVDVWVPASMLPQVRPGPNLLESRTSRGALVIGRLAPGISRAQALGALGVVAGQLAQEYPTAWLDVRKQPRRVTITPATRVAPVIRGAVIGFMALLMAAVGLVLLIACVNAANLLLSRAEARRQEIAVRLSLGASRARLIRQLMTESVVLSTLAGAGGVVLAYWLVRAVAAFRPPMTIPVPLDPSIDLGVLLFAVAISVATGLVFGLAPALQSTKRDVVASLKGEEAVAAHRRKVPVGHGLVVLQVALSLLVLVTAGLLIRTLQQSQSVHLGFDPDNVATARIDLAGTGELTPDRMIWTFEAIVDRLKQLPEVEHVSFATIVPLGPGSSRRSVTVEGYQPEPGEDLERHYNVVTPDFFQTTRIRLVRGRAFVDGDRAGAPLVAIVNEAFARRFWGDQDPLGKRISVRGAAGPWMEIVGVTENGRYVSVLDEPLPYLFLPLWQNPSPAAVLHVRSGRGAAAALIPLIRSAVGDLYPNLPVFEAWVLADLTGVQLLPYRLAAWFLGILGFVALMLAAVGLYGVLGHAVSRRRREIGVRLAIGAEPRAIRLLVLSQGLRVVGVGLVFGLAAALMVTRLLSSLLFQVSPTDPITLVVASILLLAVAAAACDLPARRAARVDPVQALRQE
jgi:predicted permease